MKKITSLLMAMAGWLFALTASADVYTIAESPTAMESLNNGMYVIKAKCKTTSGYVSHYASCSAGRAFHLTDVTLDGSDNTYVWVLTKSEDGTSFTLRNYSTGGYFPADAQRNKNFSSGTTAANRANLVAESNSGTTLDAGFVLYQTNYTNGNNKLYIFGNAHEENSSSYNLSYWDGNDVNESSACMQFAFYAVTGLAEQNLVDVTYNLTDGTNTLKTITEYDVTAGTTATIPSSAAAYVSYYYTNGTLQGDNTTISSTNKTFNVAYTKGELPFTADKQYTVKFRDSESKYLVHESGATNIASNQTMTSRSNLQNGAWKFVESGMGVKILNVAANQYVSLANSNNSTAATLADEGTEFILRSNSGSGFSVQYPGVTYVVVGDHASSKLGGWNAGSSWESTVIDDAGSNWLITEITLDKAKEIVNNELSSMSTTTYDSNGLLLYGTNESSINATKAEVSAAQSLESLYNITYTSSFAPESGVYYQIYNKRGGNAYITTEAMKVSTAGALNTDYDDSSNRNIVRTSESGALVPQLWLFEASSTNGYYYIQNANTGCYFGQCTSYDADLQMPTSKDWAGIYKLQLGQNTTLAALVTDGGHMLNAHGGTSTTKIADYSGNSTTDEGSNWYIKKVTEVPVEVNATAGYASIALPFAVSVPEGTTAYYASQAADGVLTLTEIENNIIPANTGAILAKQGGGTVTLTITTTENTIDANKLKGATAKRAGFTADATYVLALNSQNVAAFLQSELTEVPANKAYLETASITTSTGEAAQVMNFSFGGDTPTGIRTATDTDLNGTQYFDLNGHRVLYPAHGIFVTNTGKKVLIK